MWLAFNSNCLGVVKWPEKVLCAGEGIAYIDQGWAIALRRLPHSGELYAAYGECQAACDKANAEVGPVSANPNVWNPDGA
jgi:hypothetical protein